ncbi:polyphenol oxidase family protein [Tersicoccus sp. MR15.9]|uniref:polyphenol oxidase family protein n=1 Tax=Tersicoccus mangrovi TaxID=3121635 RepID=UPI002FE53060
MFHHREQVAAGTWIGFTDAGAGNLASRLGGDPAAVARNRAALLAEMGVTRGSLRFMHQVHGTAVHRLGVTEAPGVPVADALVDAAGASALAVLVADCVPIVMVADRPDGTTATAVAHAGRRGAAGGIATATVRALRADGGERIRAWLGPAICGACYEVPGDMRAEVDAVLPGSASTTREGTAGLDLRAGLERQLREAGVEVTVVPGCTRETEDLFSYRRDQATGRTAGLVWHVAP